MDYKKVNKNPKMEIHRTINCNYAVELTKTINEVKVIGVGGKDFVDKKKKLMMGILWQLMKLYQFNVFKIIIFFLIIYLVPRRKSK